MKHLNSIPDFELQNSTKDSVVTVTVFVSGPFIGEDELPGIHLSFTLKSKNVINFL